MPRSLLRKLKSSLSKTRRGLAEGLRRVVSAGQSAESLEELEELLVSADLGVDLAARAVERASSARGEDALRGAVAAELSAAFSETPRGLARAPVGPTVVLVVGVNGVGKTTTIAKLAHLLRREGASVLLGAADTFRAAGVEQLTEWAGRVGVPVVAGSQGADAAAVAFDAASAARARGVDYLILDTAGRLHTKHNLMRELEKINRVLGKAAEGAPHETLLVLDANIGQNALSQARTFAEHVTLTGLVLTKLDGTAKGGIVVSVEQSLGVPVKFVGVGEGLDDLAPFEPADFVEALLSP